MKNVLFTQLTILYFSNEFPYCLGFSLTLAQFSMKHVEKEGLQLRNVRQILCSSQVLFLKSELLKSFNFNDSQTNLIKKFVEEFCLNFLSTSKKIIS